MKTCVVLDPTTPSKHLPSSHPLLGHVHLTTPDTLESGLQTCIESLGCENQSVDKCQPVCPVDEATDSSAGFLAVAVVVAEGTAERLHDMEELRERAEGFERAGVRIALVATPGVYQHSRQLPFLTAHTLLAYTDMQNPDDLL